jgi:putative phosphoesterase
MQVGVISDTHDRLTTFRRAIRMFQRLKVGAIFHAGDFVAPFAAKLIAPDAPGMSGLPLHCCYGNNDGEKAGLKKVLPQVIDGPVTVKLAGRILVMHHFIDWLKPADIAAADVIITGHTHEVFNEKKSIAGKDKLFLNPGECCGWVTDRCTVALLDLDTLDAQIMDVAE